MSAAVIGDVYRMRTRTAAGRLRHRCPACQTFMGYGSNLRCSRCEVTYAEVTEGVYQAVCRG